MSGVKMYLDRNDWWVGYYRGDTHHHVCPLPTLVIRWARFRSLAPEIVGGRSVGPAPAEGER